MSRLRSGRKIDKAKLEALADSEHKIPLSCALKPRLKLQVLERLEIEGGAESVSELCEALLEAWVTNSENGQDLRNASEELQALTDQLKALQAQLADLQQQLNTQQAELEQEKANSEITDELLKGQQEVNQQRDELLRNLMADNILIPAPAELKQLFERLQEGYAQTRQFTPHRLLAECMLSYISKTSGYLPASFRLFQPGRNGSNPNDRDKLIAYLEGFTKQTAKPG